ncbi:MAG: DUF1778 domain-containing protein [Gemmatimonas sp.]
MVPTTPRNKPKVRRTTVSGSVAHDVADLADEAAAIAGETLSAFVAAAVEKRAREVIREAEKKAAA